MLSRTPSTSSLFLPDDDGDCSVSVLETESYVPSHRYYTRLAARRASEASSHTIVKSSIPNRGQKLVLQPTNIMDWSGPKTCRPSYVYSLSRLATTIIAVGVLGMAVAYLNDRIRHSYHPVADMTTDMHALQHEVKMVREILEGKGGAGVAAPRKGASAPPAEGAKTAVGQPSPERVGPAAAGAMLGTQVSPAAAKVDAQGRVLDERGVPIPGVRTDAQGRVLDDRGVPIPGLKLDAQGRIVDESGKPVDATKLGQIAAGTLPVPRPRSGLGAETTAGGGQPAGDGIDAQGGSPVAAPRRGATADAQGRILDDKGLPVPGVKTDAQGRVLDDRGVPIPGLKLDAQGRIVDEKGAPVDATKLSQLSAGVSGAGSGGSGMRLDAQGRLVDASGAPVPGLTRDAQGRIVDERGVPIPGLTVDAQGRIVDDRGIPVDAAKLSQLTGATSGAAPGVKLGGLVDERGVPIPGLRQDAQGRVVDERGVPIPGVKMDSQGRMVDENGVPLDAAKLQQLSAASGARTVDGGLAGQGAAGRTKIGMDGAAMQGGAGDAFGTETGRLSGVGDAVQMTGQSGASSSLESGGVPAMKSGGALMMGTGNQYPNSIAEALDQFSADKTGRKDFALESAGGAIVALRATENYNKYAKFTLLGFTICDGANGPRAMIQGSVLPGECWAFKGKAGSAVIRLLGSVKINAVSLEHISKAMSPSGEISSAPKEFSIMGLKGPNDHDHVLLGKFQYDIEGPTIQIFPVEERQQSFQYVEFRVHSNHGNEDYTCVYRLRVHGTLDHPSRMRG